MYCKKICLLLSIFIFLVSISCVNAEMDDVIDSNLSAVGSELDVDEEVYKALDDSEEVLSDGEDSYFNLYISTFFSSKLNS